MGRTSSVRQESCAIVVQNICKLSMNAQPEGGAGRMGDGRKEEPAEAASLGRGWNLGS